jgi:hypothetical protein
MMTCLFVIFMLAAPGLVATGRAQRRTYRQTVTAVFGIVFFVLAAAEWLVVPDRARWAWPMLIIIDLGLFVLWAALVGRTPGWRPLRPAVPESPPQAGEESADLRFPGPPFPARLRAGTFAASDGPMIYSQFSCEVPGEAPRLWVGSREWQGKVRHDPSMAEIDSSSSYLVRANDVAWAQSVLSADAWRLIRRIDVIHSGSFLLDLRPGTMIVRTAGALGERDRQIEFLNACYDLAELLRAALSGVAVVATGAGGGTCGVCGCGVDRGVRCAGCGAPHHADCWAYNGICSVYACGSARYHQAAS